MKTLHLWLFAAWLAVCPRLAVADVKISELPVATSAAATNTIPLLVTPLAANGLTQISTSNLLNSLIALPNWPAASSNAIAVQGGAGNANILTNPVVRGSLNVLGPVTNTSGGLMQGDWVFSGDATFDDVVASTLGARGAVNLGGPVTITNAVTMKTNVTSLGTNSLHWPTLPTLGAGKLLRTDGNSNIAATTVAGILTWDGSTLVVPGLTSNALQFGSSTTLTIKSGVLLTNPVIVGPLTNWFSGTDVAPFWAQETGFINLPRPVWRDTNNWRVLTLRYTTNSSGQITAGSTNEIYYGDNNWIAHQFTLNDSSIDPAYPPAVWFNFNDTFGWYFRGSSIADFSDNILLTNDLAGTFRWGPNNKTNILQGGLVKVVATNFAIPGFGATSNYVWTATNAAGLGEWRAQAAGGGGATNSILMEAGFGTNTTLKKLTVNDWLRVNGPQTNTSGGVMGGDFVFTGVNLFEDLSALDGGARVLGGLNVSGQLTATNHMLALGGVGFSGTVTNQVNVGYSGGTNLWIDGGRGTLFTNIVSTGLTNIYVTNILDGQTIEARVFVNIGSAAAFPQMTTSNSISGKVDVLASNAWSRVTVTRFNSTTNFSLETVSFDLAAGANISFTTNYVVNQITVSTSGGVGEANVLGDASNTNATKVGISHGKTGVTLTLRSVQAGNNMTLTNEGTNVVFAMNSVFQNPSAVLTNLSAWGITNPQPSSMVLSNLVLTVANNVTNAHTNQFTIASGTLLLKENALVTNVTIYGALTVPDTTTIEVKSNAAIYMSWGSGLDIGRSGVADSPAKISIGTNSYIWSHTAADAEIYRYRFSADNSGNNTNKIMRLWEVNTNTAPRQWGSSALTNLSAWGITNPQPSSMVLSNLVLTVANNVTNITNGWGVTGAIATGILTLMLTNASTTIASNATTVQVDFSLITPDYISTDVMRANLSVQPTNLVVGRTATLYLTGDTNANERTVTVITNGIAGGAAIRWFFNTPTNGASSFTVTNGQRSELSLKVVSATSIWAAWSPVR